MSIMEEVEALYLKKEIPYVRVGDTVRVHVIIKEGDKERTQVFEGVTIRFAKRGLRSTFTVRKVSYGVGVERIFPLHSPMVAKIDVVSRGKVRRARLYYLRNLRGKAARLKGERFKGLLDKATREARKKQEEAAAAEEAATTEVAEEETPPQTDVDSHEA